MIVFIEERRDIDDYQDEYIVNVNGKTFAIPVFKSDLNSEQTKMSVKNRAIRLYKKTNRE